MFSNYKTIPLISHASKILLNDIIQRIETKLDQEVSDEKAGFRKNIKARN